ncbi:alcohol acetyltransferase [Poronia punctata]|nr:alcohol acetyltransferase [Poronia punctata]
MNMASTQQKVIRPVGSLAKFNTARHSLGLIRSVIVTCRYMSRPYTREQLESLMENALATVILAQPILGVGIAGEDTKEPTFVHIEKIDMRRMIEWKELPRSRDDNNLVRSLEKLHEPLWEDLAGKPGWKIVIHYDPAALYDETILNLDPTLEDPTISLDISFCFHHAYADGRSGYIFHRDLRRAMNATNTSELLQDHILHLSTPPAIPPPMETLIPFTLSWGFKLRTVWTELVKPALPGGRGSNAPWTGNPTDASDPRTNIRLIRIDRKSSIKEILELCRRHNASLTGLIHALVAQSLARQLPGRDFVSSTPISLVNYVDAEKAETGNFTPGENIHCLVTALTCVHRHDEPREVWAFAADMTKRLRRRAGTLPRDDVWGLASLVGDWHDFFRGKIGKKKREITWEVSNLGSIGFNDRGRLGDMGWYIDRAIFTQGALPVGAAIGVNVSGVEGLAEGVIVTFTWQERAVDEGVMDGLVGEMSLWFDGVSDKVPG